MKSFITICTLLLFNIGAPLFAQDAVPPISPLEPEAKQPEAMVDELVLVDMGAPQVIELLETLTGKIILRRQDIAVAKINFNSRGPLTNSEAVLALESLLTLNGIMLTDIGGKFMKAVPATQVNTHVPQMISGSTLGLAPSQQIYAKLFKLDYLNAQQASGTLITPLVSQNSSIVVFEKSNALLVSDALLNLQRIESMVKEADFPQKIREEIEFVKLNFIQAAEMQDRLENLIQGPLKAYLEGSTSVTADERTNQLIIITHPGNMAVIKRVIESVDIDAAPLTATEVFALKQAKAEEVVPIIENIISGQEEGREEDAKVNRDDSPAEAGTPEVPNAPEAVAAAPTSTNTESNSSLQFSNFVGLSADERTNSIVAYGTHSDLRTLKDLIDKIDRPLPQVRIEAIITQVGLRDNESRGIDSFELDYNSTSDGAIGGDNELGIGAGTAAGSGAVFSVKDFSLDLVLGTAESKSNIRILSTPIVVVSHNQEAVINVSESRPIVTSSTSSLDSNNNTRSTVEYRDIGIQLTAKPLIGADGTVQMEVEQLIEDVNGEILIDGNPQPIITKREAKSFVTVSDGDVIILGGLQENRKDITDGSLEFLGDLPLVGDWFGSKENNYQRIELIIFLQPTILTSPEDAAAETDKEIQTAIEREALREYIKTQDLGDTYVEDSVIPELTQKPADDEAPIVSDSKANEPEPEPTPINLEADTEDEPEQPKKQRSPKPNR